MKKIMKWISISTIFALSANLAQAETRVIMLGTGSPIATYDRAGAGIAIIHDGEAYMFDAGHGTVRRAIEAFQTMDTPELNPYKINHLFLSHLHSDHTIDYPELASTLWWERDTQLNAYGPKGLNNMTNAYYDMMAIDIGLRTEGIQPIDNPGMYKVNVHEISKDGIIFDENNITVEAFSVDHGTIKPAYGYKITTPDKTIVYSGDTTYSPNLINKTKGVDILIHEVAGEAGWKPLPLAWRHYHDSAHTLTSKVAKVANQVKPGLLVLTHVIHYDAPIESVYDEVKALYNGDVVLANDLDEY